MEDINEYKVSELLRKLDRIDWQVSPETKQYIENSIKEGTSGFSLHRYQVFPDSRLDFVTNIAGSADGWYHINKYLGVLTTDLEIPDKVINHVSASILDADMKRFNWENASLIMEAADDAAKAALDIESISVRLKALSATPEGKEVADKLSLKYLQSVETPVARLIYAKMFDPPQEKLVLGYFPEYVPSDQAYHLLNGRSVHFNSGNDPNLFDPHWLHLEDVGIPGLIPSRALGFSYHEIIYKIGERNIIVSSPEEAAAALMRGEVVPALVNGQPVNVQADPQKADLLLQAVQPKIQEQSLHKNRGAKHSLSQKKKSNRRSR